MRRSHNRLGLLGKIILIFCLFCQICCPGLMQLGLVKQAHAFSVGEEKEAGEKLLTMVRGNFNLIEEPDFLQYVTRLGNEILNVTDSHYFNYHFFIVDQDEFNAFAAPSGLIFLYTGLIESMETEDELISVLAHDTAHVAYRHIAHRAENTTLSNLTAALMLLAGIASIAAGGDPDASLGLIYGGAAVNATSYLKYTRRNEEEADRLAFDWMRAMERDPKAMVGMLRKMHRVNVISMDTIPTYLLTHPEPSSRMSYVEDLIESTQHGKYKQTDSFDFQRMKYRLLSITSDPIKLLERLHKSDSENVPVMTLYGQSQAYLANADFMNAEKILRKVMALLPEKTILQTDLGRIFFESGKYDRALKLFQEARKKRPACAYTAYLLAQTLQQKEHSHIALTIYEDILRTIPTLSRIHYQIGQIKAASGKTAEGHYHLGLYYWFEGSSRLAHFHLNKAIEKAKDNDAIKNKATEMLQKIAELKKL